MARLYHIDIAQYAARCDTKWTDNLLSQFLIPGVERSRRGSARRLDVQGIQHVALIRSLTRDLGFSVPAAVRIAIRLLESESEEYWAGEFIGVRFSRERFIQRIDAMIADGVESVTPAPRGRPRRAPAGE